MTAGTGYERRIIGPPGCGKTTWLAEKAREACAEGQNPMIVSLTKAAANEVAGRDMPIARHQVGTLHSQCHYALNRPPIAEDRESLRSWNEEYPHYKLTPAAGVRRGDVEPEAQESPGDSQGDHVMTRYQILRARITPKEKYPPDVAQFAQRWEDWKSQRGLLDFTDLIERALEDVDLAPGDPDVLFVDEGQDMNALEMALIRKWGAQAGRLYIVGDPDQNLYRWRGSDPEAFLYPEIPEERWQTLSQSYRVPASVHGKAVAWIRNARNRRKAEYRPTNAEGEVRSLLCNWEQPDRITQDMEQYVQEGRTVMIIASCAYMLQKVILSLRQAGIPFHNPQRRSNGAWNPLQRREGKTSAADRLLAFLKMNDEGDLWSAEDARKFCEALKLKAAVNGAKKQAAIDRLQDEDPDGIYGATLSWEQINSAFTPEAVEAGMNGDAEWFVRNAKSASAGPLAFPAAVLRIRGSEELKKEPKVIVGTIHSVKGGEADAVYLFPDLSYAGWTEFNGDWQQMNAIYRLFYVGMTRAKETLILCQPESERYAVLQ